MADMKPQGFQTAGIPEDYERGDANLRSVASVMAIILSSALVAMLAMWGMFNVLNNFYSAPDKKMPALTKVAVVPPEPRLLPSPYTDEFQEVQGKGRFKIRASTPDVFPWDKRDLEIDLQNAEANGYRLNPDGTARIPIAEAMRREVGGGTPSLMPWQRDYPEIMQNANPAPQTFDRKPDWETTDETFNVESTGGKALKSGPGIWSR